MFSPAQVEAALDRIKTNRPFLKHQVIAVVGRFGDRLSVKRIAAMVKKLGATYIEDQSMLPTHIICSPAEFADPGKKGNIPYHSFL